MAFFTFWGGRSRLSHKKKNCTQVIGKKYLGYVLFLYLDYILCFLQERNFSFFRKETIILPQQLLCPASQFLA